jgi:cytochrome bd-type quinol oxidase subunit 2
MKIKKLFTLSMIALAYIFSSLFVTVNLATAATMDCSGSLTPKQQLQCGACEAAGDNCPANPQNTVDNTIATVVNVLSYLVGAVAVVMLIIGGFRFVTSNGNAESTKGARNTIIYAIVGLVIVAIAQVIVHFVINTTTNATSTGSNSSSGSNTNSSTNPASSNNPNTKP